MKEHLDLLVDEGLVSATAAVRSLGLHVSVWTILRWIRHGVRQRRLEAVKVGGRWFTSAAAVRRFLARSGTDGRTARRCDPGPSPATERYLDSIGLGRAPAEPGL